jgi:hypothetical protein
MKSIAEVLSEVSFTKLDTYRRCPKEFFYKYMEEEVGRGLPQEIMEEGVRTHVLIQEAIESRNIENIPVKLRNIVENYFTDPEIEKEVDFYIYDTQFKGFVDVCSYEPDKRMVSILDIKLYKEPETADQLKIYSLGLLKEYPEALAFRCWYYMAGLDYYKSFIFYRPDLEEFQEEIDVEIDNIRMDSNFDIKPGTHCSTCPYVHLCEANQTYEIVELQTMEEAETLMKKVFIADGFVKQYKERLKEFMERNAVNEIEFDEGNGKYRAYFAPSIMLKFGKAKRRD